MRQEQIEASKPLDQPKLERLLDRLRQYLIRHQIRQVRQLLKECSRSQIQPISLDLKREVEKLYKQLMLFISSEEPDLEGKNSSGWWW
jgi:hypothetical protein